MRSISDDLRYANIDFILRQGTHIETEWIFINQICLKLGFQRSEQLIYVYASILFTCLIEHRIPLLTVIFPVKTGPFLYIKVQWLQGCALVTANLSCRAREVARVLANQF